MAKKSKPKNKSKPRKGSGRKPVRRKKESARVKAERKVKELKSKEKKAYLEYLSASKNAEKYDQIAIHTKNKEKKATYKKIAKDWTNAFNAAYNRYQRYKSKLKPAKTKKRRVTKAKKTDQAAMVKAIERHKDKFTNEGNMAIYPSLNGKESDIVFFAPVNTESESNSSNITSYAVDMGAPRKDYARFSSKTISIDGLISDGPSESAHDKWVRLRTWHSEHTQVTFRGDIYYKQLLISQLDRQFTGNKNTMQVSIQFTFVRAAEITTSNKKKKHAKRSKSSKTLAGSRHKNYTAVTVKRGDTLWGFSKRYGKSVEWLQRVNKIKNANRIKVGELVYVNDRKHKAKSKIRVK